MFEITTNQARKSTMATDKQNNSIKNQDYKAILAYILVLVRDIYDGVVPERIKNRRNICQQKMSDVEIIALTICGELLGVDSEHAWFNFAKKNLSGLFVSFCDRSRYNRTKKNLSDVIKLIFEEILTRLPKSDVGIIDSFPLPVCKFGRARFHKTFKGYSADYSYCASKKEYYYGYKVHLIVDEQGFPRGFGLTGASVDDRLMVDELLENMRLCFLIGDKGYIGLKTNRTNLIALERKNCKNPKLSDLGRQQIFNEVLIKF